MDNNEPQSSREDFRLKLLFSIDENRDKFVERGIAIDKIEDDLGYFAESILSYLYAHPEDTFILEWYQKNPLGDFVVSSEYFKSKNPFTISLSYKGIVLSLAQLGDHIYRTGPSEFFGRVAMGMASSNIASIRLIVMFLEGTPEEQKTARDFLIEATSYQRRRGWHLCWAYTDWIKTRFPEVYEKMMTDGEFLSVEELEQLMKEENE
jgi:hypothetical protein